MARKFDISQYPKALETIKPFYEKFKGAKPDGYIITELSAVSHIPIIVVAQGVAIVKNEMTPEIQKIINSAIVS